MNIILIILISVLAAIIYILGIVWFVRILGPIGLLGIILWPVFLILTLIASVIRESTMKSRLYARKKPSDENSTFDYNQNPDSHSANFNDSFEDEKITNSETFDSDNNNLENQELSNPNTIDNSDDHNIINEDNDNNSMDDTGI